MRFERLKGIFRPKAPSLILPASQDSFLQHRREVMAGAAALLAGSAFIPRAAQAGYVPQPPIYQNGQNTLLQTAAAGVGGNNSSAENIAFYDPDGSLIVGPGNRADMEVVTLSPFNLFIAHMHVRFKQVAYSTSRPSAQTLWTGVGGGSFSVNNTSSFGGILTLSTGAVSAGDGGTVTMDYNPINLSGMKYYGLMYAGVSSSNQVIKFGVIFNSSNQIYLQRSDLTTEGNWVGHCVSGGTDTASSITTALNTGLNRAIYCISYDGTNVNFWVGNSNDTIVLGAQIPVASAPSLSNVYTPFISITSQGSAVNRNLNITDWYTISNG